MSLPGGPLRTRFSASSAAVWKPGRTTTSGPPQGNASQSASVRPPLPRSIGAAPSRTGLARRPPGRRARPAAGTARCRSTTAPAAASASATAPGTTAASCSNARPGHGVVVARIELAHHHGRVARRTAAGPLPRAQRQAWAHSGCGSGRAAAAAARRPSPATPRKANTRAAPSGTITSSSKGCEKSAGEPFSSMSNTCLRRLLPIRVGQVLDRQFVVRPKLAHLAEHRLHLPEQRRRRADRPGREPLVVQQESVQSPAGGEEGQDGVLVGQRFLHVGHAAQRREDHGRPARGARRSPAGWPPAGGSSDRQFVHARDCSFAGLVVGHQGQFGQRRADLPALPAKAGRRPG